ncbi:hypothetical protein DO97_17830 [Neosynechococcus sphagnicola sy1]|uniref:LOR/SDH bifunctional enzyme conserved domain-containing protein n=1 Tax=Neosynechococcus sphagnicola sy1 TaxID=1497020 RepID=A0A098TL06_9CYAN|nr:hypothetical protein DO97_17830 [Neosynechococcus sphagnicola sy1]
MLDRESRWLWAGYGFRSELDSHPYLAKWLDIEVLSLRLIDERFYHLDTCFCPLSGGYLLYYPPAFDAYSNRLIEMRVPAAKRIAIGEADAVNFACNAVNIEQIVVLNTASDELKQRLAALAFTVVETPLTEFLKAGGAAKCLTLRVTESITVETHASAAIATRTIQMQGHLLDTGLINQALDLIVDRGGELSGIELPVGRTAPEYLSGRGQGDRAFPRCHGIFDDPVDRSGCCGAAPRDPGCRVRSCDPGGGGSR